jgi:hypothetical protein
MNMSSRLMIEVERDHRELTDNIRLSNNVVVKR